MEASNHDRPQLRTSKLLQVVVPLLGSDPVEMLVALWRLGRKVVRSKAHEGMYEVLDYESRLEILDTKGKKAVLHKRQRVRFRQDNIIAFQDQASGEGDIFADYKCSPGVAVDRYRDGHRHRILISLRETRNRGDVEEFRIERTIKDGFSKDNEYFQTEINHETRNVSISVIFPRNRPPRRVTLVEQNATRTTALGPENEHQLPDGRVQVTWRAEKPRLFEAYILRWEW